MMTWGVSVLLTHYWGMPCPCLSGHHPVCPGDCRATSLTAMPITRHSHYETRPPRPPALVVCTAPWSGSRPVAEVHRHHATPPGQ